jgi:hypothetical protein
MERERERRGRGRWGERLRDCVLTSFVGSPSPKRYEKLYDLKSVAEEKRVAMRKEAEKKGLEECTFQPHVNRRHKPEELDGFKKSEALFNMSKSKKNKKDEVKKRGNGEKGRKRGERSKCE